MLTLRADMSVPFGSALIALELVSVLTLRADMIVPIGVALIA